MDEQGMPAQSANSVQSGSEDIVELQERAVRVLVVDHSPSIVRIVQHNCERVGLSVLSTTNGVEAVQILEQAKVDLIIAAVMLPDMSGFELLEQVRQDDRIANLPFILLNNRSQMGSDNDSRAYFDWNKNMPNV